MTQEKARVLTGESSPRGSRAGRGTASLTQRGARGSAGGNLVRLSPRRPGNANCDSKDCEIVPGTLDILVLRTLTLGRMHGYADDSATGPGSNGVMP
jgi:hypothetical protein